MRPGIRFPSFAVWVFAAAAFTVACSDPTPSKKKDGGTTGTACMEDAECGADGLCAGNVCVQNTCDGTEGSCPPGYACDELTLQCFSTGGGTDGGTKPDGGSGCSGRCDCPGDGEICVAGKCQAAPTDKSCVRDDQCPLGTICDFSRKCVPGCAESCDCSDSKICNTTSLQCEACSRNNPCPQGQACNAGVCEAATQCTSNAECTNKQVCKNGTCGFCTADADCKSYGTSFICGPTGVCTDNQCSDASCQASLQTPKAYCNTSTNACDTYQCIGDSDCFNGATCDLSTHTCGGTSNCSADCNGQDCAATQQVCDTSTCTCTSNTNGNLCGPANAGVAVKADCTACTIADIFSGTTCYDGADSTYTCTPGIATLLFGFLAGFVICE
jgi:hypothetical protein